MTSGTNKAADEALLDAVGDAFARLRQRTMQVKVRTPITRKELNRNLVTTIVEQAEVEVTVGAIGELLGVDASVASRMVSDCISSGCLVRVASQEDGRRTVLKVGRAGAALRERVRAQQRQAFEEITRDWSKAERVQFARSLIKYAKAAEGARAVDREEE